MFSLVQCELFHPLVHGQDAYSSPGIAGHFLLHRVIHPRSVNLRDLDNLLRRRPQPPPPDSHPFIRQYPADMRTEIVLRECLQPGQEEVVYLKTFWLRLVQRCWKKTFRLRKELVQKRSTAAALRVRARTGQWPPGLRHWPQFRV